MSDLIKDVYNLSIIEALADRIIDLYPALHKEQFVQNIIVQDWESLAFKQRMRRITEGLVAHLPSDYSQALDILEQVHSHFNGLAHLVFPDFVEVCGLEDVERSLQSLELFTPYCSSEFAIRPFIIKYPEYTTAQLKRWSQHDNYHVRRLSSEGCRPRLPWGISLPMFKKDPAPVLDILEVLKKDPSDYVRRSVGNNLNDISKDHPHLVLELAHKWWGQHPDTDWIIKHGCRSLLKKCVPEALQFFGFIQTDAIVVKQFTLNGQTIPVGDVIEASFILENNGAAAVKLRIEYGVDFLKKNGSHSRKLFKLSEKSYTTGRHLLQFKHSFKELTTRKHYPGPHAISVIVNGQEKALHEVLLNDH
jgi:3-methyladenine DNA glycosylase AlkC